MEVLSNRSQCWHDRIAPYNVRPIGIDLDSIFVSIPSEDGLFVTESLEPFGFGLQLSQQYQLMIILNLQWRCKMSWLQHGHKSYIGLCCIIILISEP